MLSLAWPSTNPFVQKTTMYLHTASPLQRASTRLNYKVRRPLKKVTNWCGYQSEKIIQNVPNKRWLSRHACTSVGTNRAPSSLSCNVMFGSH